MFRAISKVRSGASHLCEALIAFWEIRVRRVRGRIGENDLVMLNPFGIGADEGVFNSINGANTSGFRGG